jgi:hypothetical protein
MKNKKEFFIETIKSVLTNVESGKLTIPDEIKNLEGMSGTLYRTFINYLLKSLNKVNYLEVGCWKGSTAISALYGNLSYIENYTIIDSWHEFGGPRKEFENNFLKHIGTKPNLIDANCFKINPKDHNISDIDVYFYDGAHSEQDHIQAVTHFKDSCNDCFILIIDDYNWDYVVSGTQKGIQLSNLNVDFELTKPTAANGVKDTWWNGVGIFVLSKK